MTYGSGQRQIDECKADTCRDAIVHYTRLAREWPDGSVERQSLEARCGREAIRLAEIESRLAQ